MRDSRSPCVTFDRCHRTLKTPSSLSLRFSKAMEVGKDRERSPGSEDKFAEKRIREQTDGIAWMKKKFPRRALSSSQLLPA